MGIVLMLDRMGVLDARAAFRLWPLVIVAAGVVTYVKGSQVGRTNGVILMGLGGWLLLNSLGIIRIGFWDLFWPAVLIAAGTALVLQTLQRGRESAASGDGDRLTVLAVLSGVRRVSTSPRFRGGDLAAFMGGGRIDLRQATIPAGEEAVIDVLAVMGGFEIYVPPTWTVATPIVPFMGGVDDHRVAPLGSAPDGSATPPPAPRLVLRGFLMMGGVHIRS
jgi:predicted membrane protein